LHAEDGAEMRIAWLTPLCEGTGVAKYSLAAVAAVRQRHDVDIWAEPARSYLLADGFSVLDESAETVQALSAYDLVVFNLGNNAAFHATSFSLSFRLPGLVILHDRVMQDLVFPYFVEVRRDPARYLALMAHYYGSPGMAYAIRRARGLATVEHYDEFPLFEAVLANAAGVLAHSDEAAALFERYPGIVPVGRANLLFSLYDDEVTARAPKSGVEPLSIVTHGNVVPSKRVESLLSAYAASPLLRGSSVVRVVGRMSEPYGSTLRRHAETLGIAGSVTFTGAVDDRTMHRLLSEADIFVNLRHPSTEVASGALVEQVRFARPLVVSNVGFYAEVPDDVAIKVDVADEVAQLTAALELLAGDADLRERMSTAAMSFGSVAFSAEAYASAFDEIARRTATALPQVREARTEARRRAARAPVVWPRDDVR